MARYSVRWDVELQEWYGMRGKQRVWETVDFGGDRPVEIYGPSKVEVKEAVTTEARWERNRTNRQQTVQAYDKKGRKSGPLKVIPPFTDCVLP